MTRLYRYLPIFICLLLVGCGGNDGRLPLSGTVTLNGQALASGSIVFVPLGGGPATGGSIEGGKFQIPAARGPVAGNYRVEIVSYESTGEMLDDPDLPGQKVEQRRQIIPDRYNKQSELSLQVTAETAKNAEFPLTSE